MQGMQERWVKCDVCVLFATPPCIYRREPPAAAPQTDLKEQQGGATWQSWGGGAHGPSRPTYIGRPACPGRQPPPTSWSGLVSVPLCPKVEAQPAPAGFASVLGLYLVHLSLNRYSDIFYDFVSDQSVLVTCILDWKHNLHILKGKVWFRNFIG